MCIIAGIVQYCLLQQKTMQYIDLTYICTRNKTLVKTTVNTFRDSMSLTENKESPLLVFPELLSFDVTFL